MSEQHLWQVYGSAPPSRMFRNRWAARWYARKLRRLGIRSSIYGVGEGNKWELIERLEVPEPPKMPT